MMAILVIAEHDNASLNAATLSTLGAAKQLGGETHLLVAGKGIAPLTQAAAQCDNVTKVLAADDAAYAQPLAENLALLIQSLVQKGGYSHVLAPADTFGKDVLPRAAALCDSQQISEVMAVISANTFKHPVYAGNAIETVQSSDRVIFLTIRPTAFDKVAVSGGNATVENVPAAGTLSSSRFVELRQTKSERPDLTAASIVVSGGRAFGSGEKFNALLEPLADKLGAAIGASRAAVDAGYVPNDYQVGQTGKVVAPSLYLAVGISGAIQHLAGMKDSKVIVAINKDENAPIFEIADYGLVADLFDAVPELTSKL